MRAAFWLGAVSAHILVAPGHGRRGDAETFVATKMDDTRALCCRPGTGRPRDARFLCVDCESTQRLARRNMGRAFRSAQSSDGCLT